MRFGLRNPELYVLLSTPGRSRPSAATTAGIDVLRSHLRSIAAAGLLRVDEERAVRLIHAAGSGVVLSLLDVPADDRDPRLSDAVLDAVLGRILATAIDLPDGDLVSVAVTFATIVQDLPSPTDAERSLLSEWVERSIAHPGRRGR